MSAPKDGSRPRVIGIAPEPTRFRVDRLHLGLFEGRPLAIPRTTAEIPQMQQHSEEQELHTNPAQLSVEQCEDVARSLDRLPAGWNWSI